MSVLPLYHRVFLSLRDQILNGAYDWRTPMPGEQKLCAEFGVSRATIRRALELLEEEGLVERRQGTRTHVKALGYSSAQQRRSLDFADGQIKHQDYFPGDVSQNYEVVSADKELRKQFNQLEKLGRVVRVRHARGKPYCFVVTYLPLEIADRIAWASLGTKPVITAVAEAGYDFVKVEQAISATLADEEASAALETPLASPLLCLRGLFIDAGGAAIMRKDGYFRPESFEYRMTLYNKKQ